MTDYQRHNTTLDYTTVATLKGYGGGNLSEGIRRAAELVRVVYGDVRAHTGDEHHITGQIGEITIPRGVFDETE